MAALTSDQINQVFTDGICQRTSLFSLKNVDAADTVDVNGWFKVVKRAGIVSSTGTTIAGIATITGTTLTIPAGPVDDGLWLIVVGVSI